MKNELFVEKKKIKIASFCSVFSWLCLLIAVIGLITAGGELKFIFTGMIIAGGIVMFRGMKVLRNDCRCPGCGAGAMGNARDREYIGMLSAKKDMIVCPVCKKKIRIK